MSCKNCPCLECRWDRYINRIADGSPHAEPPELSAYAVRGAVIGYCTAHGGFAGTNCVQCLYPEMGAH